MGLSFLSLLYLQISYIEEMVKMRNGQFDESVKRALMAASKEAESAEVVRWLNEDISEAEKKAWEQSQSSSGVMRTQRFVMTAPDGSVRSSVELKTFSNEPSELPRAMISRKHGAKTIPQTSRSQIEMLKNRYLYQRALVDEVVLQMVYNASDKPIEERVNFKSLDQYLKAGLIETKGKVDPNESHRHAAVREIGEESGLSVELGPYLGDIEYPLSEEGSKQRHTKDRSADTKHIQFWMATPISAIDNLRRTHAFGPVHRADIGEIDEVLWLTPAEARKKLSHSTDKDILALFVDRVQEGALDAVPVIIVRHGKAEARKLWKGSDANRPITPRGAAAAYALNRELACFNPTRLATSPWVRCQETLEMFAWQTGRDMVHLDPLTEDAYAAAPDTAWECLLSEIEFALERRQPIAICMHRPVIGGMFGHLRSMCVAPSLSKRLIAKTPFMPTGTAAALFVTPTPHGPKIIDIQKVQPLVY